MTDDLVAYLLDDLSPERRAEVDAKLETDVVWRWELDRLRECMAASGDIEQCVETSTAVPDALESSQVDLEPPVDLVKKTCCFVEDSASGKFKVAKKRCKKKAAFSPETCHSGGRPWSLADVTVGAGVVLILAALIMPAIQQSRDGARNNVCAGKMKAMHTAMEQHAESHHGALPELSSSDPIVMLIAELVAAGCMTQGEAAQIVTCPNSPQAQRLDDAGFEIRIPTPEELRSASGPKLAQLIDGINFTYVLSLGYRDTGGVYRQPALTSDLEKPLMGDAPAVTAAGFQPVNHGCTLNILTKSGSVDTRAANVLPASDPEFQSLYVNDKGREEAGCHEDDVVLAMPYGSPDGPLNLSFSKTRQEPLYKVLIEVRPHATSGK